MGDQLRLWRAVCDLIWKSKLKNDGGILRDPEMCAQRQAEWAVSRSATALPLFWFRLQPSCRAHSRQISRAQWFPNCWTCRRRISQGQGKCLLCGPTECKWYFTIPTYVFLLFKTLYCWVYPRVEAARGSVVVVALFYKPEGRGFERWINFVNLLNPSGRTRPWGLLSLYQKWAPEA
jgi:hypothetical protein